MNEKMKLYPPPPKAPDEPTEADPAPVPQVTRVQRVAGHDVVDRLRHERRVKRLAEKGY